MAPQAFAKVDRSKERANLEKAKAKYGVTTEDTEASK